MEEAQQLPGDRGTRKTSRSTWGAGALPGGTGEPRWALWSGLPTWALEDAGIPGWVPLDHCCGPTKHLTQRPKSRKEAGKGREKGKEEELGSAGRGWAEGRVKAREAGSPSPAGSHPELEAPWEPPEVGCGVHDRWR